ncbi:hypothetical protein AYI68_g5749 [Smittium mucronatum]|uniref:Uncharacterized protein n=1 Tax=Smittium mucronatum TaxID=133383 RepID=A0A1R0GTJ2_9FUNG|nr:hypothetical protein AYI68_g5749 [Smittium mucronatum]
MYILNCKSIILIIFVSGFSTSGSLIPQTKTKESKIIEKGGALETRFDLNQDNDLAPTAIPTLIPTQPENKSLRRGPAYPIPPRTKNSRWNDISPICKLGDTLKIGFYASSANDLRLVVSDRPDFSGNYTEYVFGAGTERGPKNPSGIYSNESFGPFAASGPSSNLHIDTYYLLFAYRDRYGLEGLGKGNYDIDPGRANFLVKRTSHNPSSAPNYIMFYSPTSNFKIRYVDVKCYSRNNISISKNTVNVTTKSTPAGSQPLVFPGPVLNRNPRQIKNIPKSIINKIKNSRKDFMISRIKVSFNGTKIKRSNSKVSPANGSLSQKNIRDLSPKNWSSVIQMSNSHSPHSSQSARNPLSRGSPPPKPSPTSIYSMSPVSTNPIKLHPKLARKSPKEFQIINTSLLEPSSSTKPSSINQPNTSKTAQLLFAKINPNRPKQLLSRSQTISLSMSTSTKTPISPSSTIPIPAIAKLLINPKEGVENKPIKSRTRSLLVPKITSKPPPIPLQNNKADSVIKSSTKIIPPSLISKINPSSTSTNSLITNSELSDNFKILDSDLLNEQIQGEALNSSSNNRRVVQQKTAKKQPITSFTLKNTVVTSSTGTRAYSSKPKETLGHKQTNTSSTKSSGIGISTTDSFIATLNNEISYTTHVSPYPSKSSSAPKPFSRKKAHISSVNSHRIATTPAFKESKSFSSTLSSPLSNKVLPNDTNSYKPNAPFASSNETKPFTQKKILTTDNLHQTTKKTSILTTTNTNAVTTSKFGIISTSTSSQMPVWSRAGKLATKFRMVNASPGIGEFKPASSSLLFNKITPVPRSLIKKSAQLKPSISSLPSMTTFNLKSSKKTTSNKSNLSHSKINILTHSYSDFNSRSTISGTLISQSMPGTLQSYETNNLSHSSHKRRVGGPRGLNNMEARTNHLDIASISNSDQTQTSNSMYPSSSSSPILDVPIQTAAETKESEKQTEPEPGPASETETNGNSLLESPTSELSSNTSNTGYIGTDMQPTTSTSTSEQEPTSGNDQPGETGPSSKKSSGWATTFTSVGFANSLNNFVKKIKLGIKQFPNLFLNVRKNTPITVTTTPEIATTSTLSAKSSTISKPHNSQPKTVKKSLITPKIISIKTKSIFSGSIKTKLSARSSTATLKQEPTTTIVSPTIPSKSEKTANKPTFRPPYLKYSSRLIARRQAIPNKRATVVMEF